MRRKTKWTLGILLSLVLLVGLMLFVMYNDVVRLIVR